MRNTPEITFKLDTSIERGVEMSRLIDEVMQKDRESEVRNEEDYADEN
jgi:ribosome-binding factor A